MRADGRRGRLTAAGAAAAALSPPTKPAPGIVGALLLLDRALLLLLKPENAKLLFESEARCKHSPDGSGGGSR